MKIRKLLVKLHLYVGITVGAVLVVTGITGSLLVFGRDADRAAQSHLTSVNVGATRANLGAIEEKVKARYPGAGMPYINLPRNPTGSIEFYLSHGDNLPLVYADPYTGEILGVRDQHSMVFEWIFRLHTGKMGGDAGEWVAGIAAFVLLFLSLTGVYLWFPGRRNLRRGFVINTKRGWKRTIYDLHNVVGFYASILLVLLSMSGIYLIFHDGTAKFINLITFSPPAAAPPEMESPQKSAQRISLDEAVRQAQLALPGAQLTYVLPPSKAGAPFVVRGKLGDEWHPNGRSVVYLDSYTGEVLHIENALNAPLGTRIANALYPLHIGIVGGMANRLVQVIVGLVPALLYVTGFLMWFNRRKRRNHLTKI